ncbi:unnamed protein product [Rotaria socialis]|uniref:Uncharacterized protein n=1 Tax=Rotaria socialis TaxID=392032 RepID=A0A818H6K4_9BILA|nr:unnamed protein product [Rotaria socialis]CAF3385937.1 unnamed protein product [Rotaria socialis]CAF3503144.1 unnamed protein product [Rotaria socialis]CAF3682948.1 unnamed protein product [Rotaria socialis]CAF3750776.1 unnamed protein product [Rotaria socialis]
MRFPPRHLRRFHLFCALDTCKKCWSEDVYSRFADLGLVKDYDLEPMSTGRWFVVYELILGNGMMCQRCIQPNLQLSGSVEMDGSRFLRDRIYTQHGPIPPIERFRKSNDQQNPNQILNA